MSYPQPGQQGPYQAYPGGPGPMPAGIPKPPLPGTVRNAFYLMLAGAVLSVVSLLVSLGSKSALRTSVQNASPNLTPDQVNTAVNAGYALGILIALLGAGLWVWMAFMNKAGRNWARITGTVFFGIDTLSLLGLAAQHTATGVGVVLDIVEWLIGLAIVILIWRKVSGEYYKPQPQYVQPPYGGYPMQ
jgi:hypothetical protein